MTNGVATKYYYFGKQRVAMKVGSTVTYLHGDHLGSTSATTNSAGTSTSSQLYYAYGNIRSGSAPTDFGFTGQRRDASANLMYYNARYYDPTLGRFVSADTMVPSAGNPQSLNRYAYVLNNPVKYVDPSGHFTEDAIDDYLRRMHGEKWRKVREQWESDTEWWAMLLEAQDGDVLFGQKSVSTHGFFFAFQGTENKVLNGIDSYCPTPCPMTREKYSLEDIQQGYRKRHPSWYNWIGFIRGIDTTPSFYIRSGHNFIQQTTPSWARDGLNWASAIGFGAATAPFTAGTSAVATVLGIAGGGTVGFFGSNFLIDAMDMEATDVQVRIGPAYFNYQFEVAPGGGAWKIEHYSIYDQGIPYPKFDQPQ